jgi:hypothetical protein
MFVSMGSTAGASARARVAALLVVFAALAWTGTAAAAPAKPLPAVAPAANDALTRAAARGDLTQAQYSLQRARSLFDLRAVRARFGEVARPDPHAATMILRDLAVRLADLSPAERKQARGLLARPDEGDGGVPEGTHGWDPAEQAAATSDCSDSRFCIHYTTAGDDAADVLFATAVRDTIASVWDNEVTGYGYRAPLSDIGSANNGGDARLDVYLLDLGLDGIFGYCTSDDPNLFNQSYQFFAFSVFCALDNDYVGFGPRTPTEYLQVTAAHEFFHAVQFAYDFLEDIWLMEGSAAWIEDEVYPAINDNFIFLPQSPLRVPTTPVDRGDGGFEYGSWIFFKYLSERLVGDRVVLRHVWERADGSQFAAFGDMYSIQAVRSALAAHGKGWNASFARFARDNRLRNYADGAIYPTTPTARTWTIRPARRSTGWQGRVLRHLANRFYSFNPGTGVRSTGRLRIEVDLPPTATAPAAHVLIAFKSGATSFVPVRLNGQGNGARTVTFARNTVNRVDLILTNASTRYDLSTCFDFPPWTSYSCGGARSRDDGRSYRFRAVLARR